MGSVYLVSESGVPFTAPCGDVGKSSDGYHTFDDLYEHRHWLFIALVREMRQVQELSKKLGTSKPFQAIGWKSWKHSDGSMAYEGWFLACLDLPEGQISYHLPAEMWAFVDLPHWDVPPTWDGHTATDVVDRLKKRVTV